MKEHRNLAVTGPLNQLIELTQVLEENNFEDWKSIKGKNREEGNVLYIIVDEKRPEYFLTWKSCAHTDNWFNIETQRKELFNFLQIEDTQKTNNMSNIGRKVRITENYAHTYSQYVGKIGIITGEDDLIYFEVKMEDGREIMPYKPTYEFPQCEFVEDKIEPFIVSGNKHLLEAFEKELQQIGWKYIGTISNKKEYISISGGGRKDQYFYFDSVSSSNNKQVFNLPEQWNEAIDLAKKLFDSLNNNIKVGDWIQLSNFSISRNLRWGKVISINEGPRYNLICPEENNSECSCGDSNNPKILTKEQVIKLFTEEINERGYKKGVKVNSLKGWGEVSFEHKEVIIKDTSEIHMGGTCVWTLEKGWAKIVKEEQFRIEGYDVSFREGRVHFGCQSFSKQELETVLRLLESPVNAFIIIGNTKITREIINKLIKMFN